MSSGEKILASIREESEKNIADIKSDSERKCKEILEKGSTKAREIKNAAEKKTDEQTQRLKKSNKSRAELEKRNTILKTKRAEIDKAVKAVETYMTSLDDKEYFDLIYKLAATLGKKEGTVFLNSGDLKKAPSDFEQKFARSGIQAKLSSTPDDSIKNGFILKNGDIEDNMSFTAIIADKREAVEDLINRELFKD